MTRCLFFLSVCVSIGTLAIAQTTSNINLTINVGNVNYTDSNTVLIAQTGSLGPLGNATLMSTSSTSPINGSNAGPLQIGATLSFNELDTITLNFSQSDPTSAEAQNVSLSGGTITGGTGAYAGATGSLDLSVAKDVNSPYTTATTTGSGTLTVGGKTMPLTLTNFRGGCCLYGPGRDRPYFTGPINVSGSLGSGTGSLIAYYYFNQPLEPTQVTGFLTISFNSADSLFIGFSYVPLDVKTGNPPSSFSGGIGGGTGKYQNANGQVTYSSNTNGTTFHVTGTMTVAPLGPVITVVKTAYGLPQIAYNTWLEIHGQNLVPADTPPSGVDWSSAPDFANGMLPTDLGSVGVLFGTTPGYVYYYCSAATNPNCADDQINVLAPLLPTGDPGNSRIFVSSNGLPIASSHPFRVEYSPAFFILDTMGHVAARHIDASLVGPASLYPGYTTPAKAAETISLYGTGFGPVPEGIVMGSSTQSGTLNPNGLSCWISGLSAKAVGALVSPGLYQLNITIPNGVSSGDNPVNCTYSNGTVVSTFPGALITVQ